MAKVIINGAQFRPFTMDELLKPLALATEEHHRIQDQYDAMAQEASFWDLILPKDESSKSRQAYQSYMDDMQAQVNALNESGLNPQVRANISRIRRNNPIQAFNVAYDALQKENQIRQQRGNNAVYQQPTLTIDDFLFGNTPNNTYADLNQLTSDAAAIAQAEAKNLIGSSTFTKAVGSGGQYWQVAQTSGIPAAVIAAALDPNLDTSGMSDSELESLGRLRQSVGGLYNQIGYTNDEGAFNYDVQGQGAINNAIMKGLLTGIENTDYSLQANRGYETPSQQTSNAIARFPYKWENGQIVGMNDAYMNMLKEEANIKGQNRPTGRGTTGTTSAGHNYNLAVRYGGVADNGTELRIADQEGFFSNISNQGDSRVVNFTELNQQQQRSLLRQIFNYSNSQLDDLFDESGHLNDDELAEIINERYQLVEYGVGNRREGNKGVTFRYLDKVDNQPPLAPSELQLPTIEVPTSDTTRVNVSQVNV